MLPEFSHADAFENLIESVRDNSERPWPHNLVIPSRQAVLAFQRGLNPYCSWPIHGCSYNMVDYPSKAEE